MTYRVLSYRWHPGHGTSVVRELCLDDGTVRERTLHFSGPYRDKRTKIIENWLERKERRGQRKEKPNALRNV